MSERRLSADRPIALSLVAAARDEADCLASWVDELAGVLATPPLAPLCLYYPSRRNPPAAFKVFVDLARELSRSSRAR
mgnify:CR=1 FL=1